MSSGVLFYVFVHLRLAMGRTKRCPGCNFPEAEHTFRKFGKKGFSGPVQDDVPQLRVEGDTVRQEQDPSPQDYDSSIQATLNSLLGVVKTLTAG